MPPENKIEVKTLKEICDEFDKKTWGNDRRVNPRREIDALGSVQKIKLVRDPSVSVKMPRGPITTPSKSLAMFRDFFRDVDVEVIGVLCLNANKEYLGLSPAGTGGLNHVVFDPWEIIKVMALHNAAACIVAHNHPSGNVIPSEDDITSMLELKAILQRLGRPMLDFMVIGFDKEGGVQYYSHKDESYDLSC